MQKNEIERGSRLVSSMTAFLGFDQEAAIRDFEVEIYQED